MSQMFYTFENYKKKKKSFKGHTWVVGAKKTPGCQLSEGITDLGAALLGPL